MTKKIKVIDLFNVKYDEMDTKINLELSQLQDSGKTITDLKVMGSALNKCAVFVLYED